MFDYNLIASSNRYDFRDKKACVRFFKDSMLNKTITMFKYNNLPKSLPERDLEIILQTMGYGIITEHNGDIVALWGGFAPPLDIYYRPTKVIVNNPWANIDKEYTIDKDCILIRNDPLDRGLLPIIQKYGTLLTEAELTEFISLINFRAIFAITAEDDDQYASATKYLEQIENGELGVMMSSGLKKGIETQPYSNGSSSYLTQVIEILQYIKGSFYQEIGLDCNYNMKRERLSESESGLNKDVLRPLIDSMLEERQKALDLVNEKYGTNITIEFNSSWAKYNDLDETIDSDITEEKQEEITEVVDEETTEETVEETTEETVEEIEFTEELVDKVIDKLIEKIDDDKEEEDVNDKGNDADTNE